MAPQQTKDEQLYQKLRQHEQDITAGEEKDSALLVELLEYIYDVHACTDLSGHDELVEIVDRAYNSDRLVLYGHQQRSGTVSCDATADDCSETCYVGQASPYVCLLTAMDHYLDMKLDDDSSEEVSTPEKAQEYVRSLRADVTKFSEVVLEGSAASETTGTGTLGDKNKLQQAISKGIVQLAKTADAELIAEAARPYKTTQEGKENFGRFKAVVERVITSLKNP